MSPGTFFHLTPLHPPLSTFLDFHLSSIFFWAISVRYVVRGGGFKFIHDRKVICSLICLLDIANMSHWPLITKLGLEEACVSWNFIDTIKTMMNNDLWWLPMREAIFGESLQVEIKELRCLYPRIIQGQEWLITIKNHILHVYT